MAFSNASWKSMTGQRAIGTVYTNNTGFEIAVSVKVSALQNTRYLALLVDGIAIDQFAHSGDFWKSQMTVVHNLQAIVPAGSTYQLVNTAGSGTLQEWYELRRT